MYLFAIFVTLLLSLGLYSEDPAISFLSTDQLHIILPLFPTEDSRIVFLTTDQLHMIHPNSTQKPTIQFNCTATGSPGLQILWSHNDNLIPSDSEDFHVATNTTEEGGLISLLGVRDPKLADSGNITCSASIRYRLADDGEMGDLATFSHSFSRNLVILGKLLQNLLEPFVFLL